MAEEQMTIDQAAGAVMEMDQYLQAFAKLRDVVMVAKRAGQEQAAIDGLIKERSEELARLTRETAEAKSGLVDLRGSIASAREEIGTVGAELKALKGEVAAINSTKQQLDAEVISRKRFIAEELEKEKSARETYIQNLDAAMKEKTGQLSQLKMKLAEFRKLVPAGEVNDG